MNFEDLYQEIIAASQKSNFDMFINPDELTPTIAEKLKSLSHEDINKTDKDGNTILHIAASGINVMLLEVLLSDSRINVNSQNNKGDTALHIIARKSWGKTPYDAIDNNDVGDDMLQVIFKHTKNINPNIQNNKGDTALSSMIYENFRDKSIRPKPIKQFLLNNNFQGYVNLDIVNEEGKTARYRLQEYCSNSQLLPHGERTKMQQIMKEYNTLMNKTTNLVSWIIEHFPSPDSPSINLPDPKSSDVISHLKIYENNRNLLVSFFETTHNMNKKNINECLNRVDNYISCNFAVLTKICNSWESRVGNKTLKLPPEIQYNIFKHLKLSDVKEDNIVPRSR
ncbi:Ankyrin repeat protein [Rickettsiales bacterium Ac37b]|nr:Ankyrin repeat protein [Rickettsiales bacterium Ac37b]